MKQDEITSMALEACSPYQTLNTDLEFLTRFAALVAAHAKQEYIDSVYEQHRETMFSNKDLGMLVDAVKAEREACAKVCDEEIDDWDYESVVNVALNNCAAAIRARGNK